MSAGDAPRLVSDTHALMAVGSLSARLAAELAPGEGRIRVPEPPEWLELWNEAVAVTHADALALLREELGSHDPTASDRLEIEAIARGHYDAYTRLDEEGAERAGGFLPWSAIPDPRRALMQATIADMITSRLIDVGPAAAHPKGSRELWVVFDALPGKEGGRFVEVEDVAGASHGADRGLRWEPHPDSTTGLVRLGPFPTDRGQFTYGEAEPEPSTGDYPASEPPPEPPPATTKPPADPPPPPKGEEKAEDKAEKKGKAK